MIPKGLLDLLEDQLNSRFKLQVDMLNQTLKEFCNFHHLWPQYKTKEILKSNIMNGIEASKGLSVLIKNELSKSNDICRDNGPCNRFMDEHALQPPIIVPLSLRADIQDMIEAIQRHKSQKEHNVITPQIIDMIDRAGFILEQADYMNRFNDLEIVCETAMVELSNALYPAFECVYYSFLFTFLNSILKFKQWLKIICCLPRATCWNMLRRSKTNTILMYTCLIGESTLHSSHSKVLSSLGNKLRI